MFLQKKEKKGIILGLFGAALWGMFPVLVQDGVQRIPPLTFVAMSAILASFGAFVYALIEGKLFELKRKEAYTALGMITLCIVIVPYLLFFVGAQFTSGVNATMLLLSEVIFTYAITSYVGEKHTSMKLYGTLGVFFGALFILFNGSFSLNTGDILIFFSTITYPIGNVYSKKALQQVSPSIILFTRFLLGAAFFIILARIFESTVSWREVIAQEWKLLAFNGFVLLGISKVIWYESLKRLDITKAIMLAMTFPLFSLVLLVTYFGETITWYQWIGVIIMMIGVYFTVKRPSTDITKTTYHISSHK